MSDSISFETKAMIIYSLWSIRHYAVFDQNTTLFTHLHVSETTSTVKAYEVVGCAKRESEWHISTLGTFQLLRPRSIKIWRYLHICMHVSEPRQ